MFISRYYTYQKDTEILFYDRSHYIEIIPDSLQDIRDLSQRLTNKKLIYSLVKLTESDLQEGLLRLTGFPHHAVEINYRNDLNELLSTYNTQRFIVCFDSSAILKENILADNLPGNVIALKYTPEADSWNTNLEIRDILKNNSSSHNIISYAHGSKGLLSRVMSRSWGSYLSPLPDQEDITTNAYTESYFKYVLSGSGLNTHITGLTGNPISHSLSPVIHNFLLKENKLHGVYLPFPADDFNEFHKFCIRAGIHGLSVTTPHKDSAFQLSTAADQLASKVEAANTIKFINGKSYCINSDGPGFCDSLSNRIDISGKNILIIGSGGAGRPIIATLVAMGANVYLAGRNQNKLVSAAVRLGCHLHEGNAGRVRYHCVINTTSVAYSHEDVSGLLAGLIPPKTIAADLHYSPPFPYFLEEASKVGCKTINGLDMLLYQAVRQFDFWFPGINRIPFAELKEYILNTVKARY